MKHHPIIQAVATAVPPHRLAQADLRDFASTLFRGRVHQLDRLISVFEHTLIEHRHLSQPLAWFGEPHTFAEANALYEQMALQLSEQASCRAIEQAGIAPDEIALVILVSTTGIATPSLDSKLIQCLGLPAHTARLPIWGLGCAGGVAGLARAAELAHAFPGKSILLVAVELCSLTFQFNDLSKSNLVATTLFGDGAAAILLRLGEEGAGPQILNSYSHLFPHSQDIMGWDVVETGLKVRFARSIPVLVERHMPGLVQSACATWDIQPEELAHFVFHPGGPKVLQAYADSLNLAPEKLAQAYKVWADYGNMSSPTVLFVLEQFLRETARSGKYGLMAALGPGFSAEQVLFRW